MAAADPFYSVLSDLLEQGRRILPVTGLGFVYDAGRDVLGMTFADALNVGAYRFAAEDCHPSFRPDARDVRQLAAEELMSTPAPPVEARAVWTGLPEDMARHCPNRRFVVMPLPHMGVPAQMIAGLSTTEPANANAVAKIGSLAAMAADLVNRGEHPDAQVARWRRLEAIERLLPELLNVLDVRDIFDRVSSITRDV